MNTTLKNNRCHWCKKELSRKLESKFTHCFECGLKRLEELTLDFDPCPQCTKQRKSK